MIPQEVQSREIKGKMPNSICVEFLLGNLPQLCPPYTRGKEVVIPSVKGSAKVQTMREGSFLIHGAILSNSLPTKIKDKHGGIQKK